MEIVKRVSPSGDDRLPPPDPTRSTAEDATTSIADLAQVISCRREQLRHAIADAAYFRAQRRGFAPGHEVEDWLAAEQEILGDHAS